MKQNHKISRIHRLLGQLRGIEQMLEKNRPCLEITQQLLAVRASIEQLCVIILKEETAKCFRENSQGNRKKLKEVEKLADNLFKI